jgi:hypothetical protein
MDELGLAFRRLVKRPGAMIASIVTLAVSIGAARSEGRTSNGSSASDRRCAPRAWTSQAR